MITLSKGNVNRNLVFLEKYSIIIQRARPASAQICRARQKGHAAMKNQTDYILLCQQLEALTEGERDTIANLANASAAFHMNLSDINWVGFYLAREGQLILGPFQGRPACVRIAFGKGVCGTAAATGETQLVANVHEFAGHIACDAASNSEIVVPIRHAGKLVALLDIDSSSFGRFTQDDREGLERCAALLGEACDWAVGGAAAFRRPATDPAAEKP